MREKCVSDDSFIANKEVIGDADLCAQTRRLKDVETEVGHVWLEVESDIRKSLAGQSHASQYNLDRESEAEVS